MDIGKKVYEKRLECKMTMKDLAERTEISVGAISKIENGKTIPNVITIKNIANAMGTSVSYFFMEEEDHIELIREKECDVLVRNQSNRGEVTEQILARGKDNQMQPCIITFTGGSHSGEEITHKGEEFTYVLEGRVRCILDHVKVYDLEQGDTLYFPSNVAHRWENLSEEKQAKIMVVATPASF